jgi:hypothetical protein
MITLRRPATTTPASANSIVVAGDLTGNKNGINNTFLTEYNYQPNRISISYNGQVLSSPNDFIQSGEKEIQFIWIRPVTSDVLKVLYEREGAPLQEGYYDIDLVYSSESWETIESTYAEIPFGMQVYLNGVKQKTDYYTSEISAGKIRILFNFLTSETDWANIVYIQQ